MPALSVFWVPRLGSSGNVKKLFYKIIWIVRAFWLVNKCVFIALWSTKMAWTIWLTVSELWEFTVRALYIVFLFVNNENNNFIIEIKHVVRTSIAWWKPLQSRWKFSSRWKPSTMSRVLTDLHSNSPKRSPWFSPGYEGTENMFYLLSKYFSQRCEQVDWATCSAQTVNRNTKKKFAKLSSKERPVWLKHSYTTSGGWQSNQHWIPFYLFV